MEGAEAAGPNAPMHERIHAEPPRRETPGHRALQPPDGPVAASPREGVRVLECGQDDRLRLRSSPEPALHLVRGSGSTATMEIPEGWWTVLVPTSGRPMLVSDGIEWHAGPDRCLIWDRRLTLVSAADDAWLCLCGPESAWLRVCPGSAIVHDLFPVEDACPPDLAKRMANLFDEVRASQASASGLSWQVRHIVSDLHRTQLALRDLLPRCPGRTRTRKRWTMTRLLRIRHAIVSDQSVRANLRSLSSRANCSRGHLSRIHRGVFDETPIEYALRMRLLRALELVTESDLAFCDIAEATGFESASSFARAFRRCHGTTPTQARIRFRRPAGR